jgi:hypothetical protein
VKLHAHFLADSANFSADQTFAVFKGGITEIQALAFPTLAKFVVITRLEFDKGEAAKPHRMQSDITLPTGQHVVGPPQLIALRADPNQPRAFANVITQMNAVFEIPGELMIRAQIDGESLPLLYLIGRKVEVVG